MSGPAEPSVRSIGTDPAAFTAFYRRSAREQRAESLIAGRRLLDAEDVDRLMERIDAFQQVRELHEALLSAQVQPVVAEEVMS